MGCGNPPALTAMEEGQDEHSLTTKPSGADDSGRTYGAAIGADIMSFPFSLEYPHFPRHDLQGDCRSYPPVCKNENSRLHGYIDSNFQTNSETNANLISVKNDMSEFCISEMPYSDVSMRDLRHTIDGNTIAADYLMNNAVSSTDYRKSEVDMNFMPPRFENATGYPIKTHGAEARNSRVSRSQSGKFSSECSTSALPLVDSFGVTRNKNDSNTAALPFSFPQKFDGSFLTLGIGGSTETRSNSNFNTREMSSKLEDVVSSQCNNSLVGQSPNNPLNLTQLMGRAARIQTNAGGVSSSAYNLTGMMSNCNEVGFNEDSSRLNPVVAPDLQTMQSNTQLRLSAKHDTFTFGLTPSSLPFGSNLMPQPEYATPIPSVPEITKSIDFVNQSISQKQDYWRKSSANVSSESSRNYLSDRLRGNSINHAQLGKLIPLADARGTQNSCDARGTQNSCGVRVPVSVQQVGVAKFGSSPSSVRPMGHLDTSHNAGSVENLGNRLFPERTGFQISKGSSFQSDAAGPFPKRLGVQPNDFAIARTTKGPPPIHLAAPVNPYRPIVSPGQQTQHKLAMPAQLSRDFHRVNYSRGHIIPVANLDIRPQAHPIVSHPYLKRQTENSPTARFGQRRKIFPQPVIHHSTTRQRQSIPASIPARVYTPPVPLHVKWQGFDGPLEPIGQKCLLCKRDLSFTAEGPVSQPNIPPAAAVLPCGHTFHDHCLQIITPEDQSKDPPCIPCAIGET